MSWCVCPTTRTSSILGISDLAPPRSTARGSMWDLEEIAAVRHRYGFGAIGGAQAFQHAGDVELDRALADAQPHCDLLVRQPRGHQPQHLKLALAQHFCGLLRR